MTSSFTWMDYSEQQKRQMLDVVDLFKEQDTRDELGVGVIRDAFSDLLFPGTGTMQTRARYFLFIPWIYADLEQREVCSAEAAGRARRVEVALIDSLAKAHPGRGEGVIGVSAREDLQRLPSNIYWLGLETWGIRRFRGSQDRYHRSLDRYYLARPWSRSAEETEAAEDPPSNWHGGVPEPSSNFPDKVSFNLTVAEARYLRERIMARVPHSLLAFLVDKGRPGDEAAFPWEHPLVGDFPSETRTQLVHGRNFSEVLHGAALLYNLMLAESAKREELVSQYRTSLKRWLDNLRARRRELLGWDHRQFWRIVLRDAHARVAHPTRAFIEQWLELALDRSSLLRIGSNNRARRLIRLREKSLKGTLARLENRRALELWNGEAGTAQMDFRWSPTNRIVEDILAGLRGDRHA
ncbi:MAG: hypothetical protein IT578_00770 [Verrucomicrobiae bacterium]|nr:hypothetical protein [Verrucomicrobiae bacterium]